jgi:hypothetical protein
MSQQTPEPLREELEEAIAKVRAQIEIQQVSNHYVGSEGISAEALRELQAELVQLEAALASLR